jgi:hypothetical protein
LTVVSDATPPGAEPFAALGERLHQALLDAYHSRVGDSTLFAFVPGGTPVPDTLVQGGVVNPLQVTTWLATVAEAPLAIDVAEAAVTASYASLQRAASMVEELVRFALPAAGAQSPAGERFITMRDQAAANDVGQFVLACEPPDWPMPDAPYWTTFDSTQDQTTSTTTTSSTTPDPGQPIRRRLWHLHELPNLADIALADPVPVRSVNPQITSTRLADVGPIISALAVAPRPRLALADARVEPRVARAPIAVVAGTPASTPVLHVDATHELAFERALFVLPRDDDTTTTTTSTADETITLSLAHTVVTIDRSAWWNDNLVRDPGWYIPGLPVGAWVEAPATDEAVIVGLPVALLLVKSLHVTGTFSDQDVAQLKSGNAGLGPFSLQQGTSTSTDDTTTIASDGMQLIGLFCAPLPQLPPQDGTAPPRPTDGTQPSPPPDPDPTPGGSGGDT